MTTEFKNYIAGEWDSSFDGAFFEQRNPADLQEVTGYWPASTSRDVARAVDSAEEAFEGWKKLTVYERSEYMKRALEIMSAERDEIAAVLTLENGKTLAESQAEVTAAIKEMDYQINEALRGMGGNTVPSAQAGIFAYSHREPLGVVAVISPWNFPFNVPGRKCTPALMAGNTAVFKPASLTPQTGLRFIQLFEKAGLPPGVINFITGGGRTVGDELTTNPKIKAISFTGSTGVGRSIHQKAALNMTRTQLEMGGKNPLIVLEDADLHAAAKAAAIAGYACAGQWCTSTSRVLVIDSVKDDFIELLRQEVGKIIVGDGREPSTTMGPVCGGDQLEAVMNYIKIGQQEGAILLTGGNRLADNGLGKGCFIEPTIFVEVKPEMRVAREEIFGPVLSVIAVKNFETAMRVANDIDFGLSSSIYTNDLKRAMSFIAGSEVGLAHVNMVTAYKEPQLAFGGVKASGYGIPEAGNSGIEFFSEHKVTYISY